VFNLYMRRMPYHNLLNRANIRRIATFSISRLAYNVANCNRPRQPCGYGVGSAATLLEQGIFERPSTRI